ncbi:MAG: DUF167 domain-containing protein [Candidatus Vogelbacteria bacterium]|nr:DUF167 domain-containing protein [Candidatus Vogelbacteria bacterium]
MYIKIRATAGARKEFIEKVSEDTFKISVRDKAERNMANERIRELLARYFILPPVKIRLVSGHHSQSKIFDVLN